MSNKLYTLKDWRNDHVLKIKIGQYVDYGVINQLMDGLPPLTYNDGIFQVGEPDDQNVKTGELLFKTFIEDGGYRYVGLCPEGSTVDETKDSYGYQRDRNKNNIQENKKHMKITEKELHNLISECVQEVLMENQQDELSFGQIGAAGSTLFGKGNGGIRERLGKSIQNFKTQGELEELANINNSLMKFVKNKQLDPNITISQLIGITSYQDQDGNTQYKKRGFGKLTGAIGNRQSQISKRGGRFFNK